MAFELSILPANLIMYKSVHV